MFFCLFANIQFHNTTLTWHLHYIVRIGRRYDFPSMIVCKMLRNILFRVHCIANRLDRAVSLRILLGWSHRPSVHTSIRVVKMLILMRCGRGTADSKTDSIARSSLSRSLLCVLVGYLLRWEQFWMDFLNNFCYAKKFNRFFFGYLFCMRKVLAFRYLLIRKYLFKYRRGLTTWDTRYS